MTLIFENKIAHVWDVGETTFEGYMDDGQIISARYTHEGECQPGLWIQLCSTWEQTWENWPAVKGIVWERDVDHGLSMENISTIIFDETGLKLVIDPRLERLFVAPPDTNLLVEEIAEYGLGGALERLDLRKQVHKKIEITAFELKKFNKR